MVRDKYNFALKGFSQWGLITPQTGKHPKQLLISAVAWQDSSPSLTVNRLVCFGETCDIKLYFYECVNVFKETGFNFIFVNILWQHVQFKATYQIKMYCKRASIRNYTSAVRSLFVLPFYFSGCRKINDHWMYFKICVHFLHFKNLNVLHLKSSPLWSKSAQ